MSNETVNKIGLVNLPDMPESVDNALKNLTDKPTANIGHTFGDIWYLVFGGISQSSYENFLKWGYFKHLQKEYEDRSQRKIVELEKGICRLTPLGQSFVDICIS